MAKELYYGEEARRKLQAGVDQLANTVKLHLDLRAEMCFLKRSSDRR